MRPDGRWRQLVRMEYGHVPDQTYRDGRLAVLEAFLARDSIYSTPRFRAFCEAPARNNLAGEIADLKMGVVSN